MNDALEEKGFDPLAYRMLVLQSHYRKQLAFGYDNLLGAQKGLERLSALALKIKTEAGGPTSVKAPLSPRASEHRQAILAAMANDLGTPQALAQTFSILEDSKVPPQERVRVVSEAERLFGLGLFAERAAKSHDVPQAMLDLLRARNQARTDKNWGEADRLRKEILDKGYDILDGSEGSSLKRRL